MKSRYLLLVDDDDMALLKEVLGSDLAEQLPEWEVDKAVHNESFAYRLETETEDK